MKICCYDSPDVAIADVNTYLPGEIVCHWEIDPSGTAIDQKRKIQQVISWFTAKMKDHYPNNDVSLEIIAAKDRLRRCGLVGRSFHGVPIRVGLTHALNQIQFEMRRLK